MAVASYTPPERHCLTPEELAGGVRLACQVKVDRDLAITIPEETCGIREYRTQVTGLRDLTCDIKEVRLKLLKPPELHFRAGQSVSSSAPSRGAISTAWTRCGNSRRSCPTH